MPSGLAIPLSIGGFRQMFNYVGNRCARAFGTKRAPVRYNQDSPTYPRFALPLYEYRCPAGHRFEKIQSFSAPEQLECPKCGQLGERLLSAPAIQFKGSGFYLTDYGKSGGSKGVAGESGGVNAENKAGSESKTNADASKGSAPTAPASTPSSTPAPSSAPATGSSGSSSS